MPVVCSFKETGLISELKNEKERLLKSGGKFFFYFINLKPDRRIPTCQDVGKSFLF
jgi:hypothetical protein